MVGAAFEVVCLPKDVVAWMDVFCHTRADLFDYAGDVIAKHNWQATFYIKAPVTDAMLVGVHCMGTVSQLMDKSLFNAVRDSWTLGYAYSLQR